MAGSPPTTPSSRRRGPAGRSGSLGHRNMQGRPAPGQPVVLGSRARSPGRDEVNSSRQATTTAGPGVTFWRGSTGRQDWRSRERAGRRRRRAGIWVPPIAPRHDLYQGTCSGVAGGSAGRRPAWSGLLRLHLDGDKIVSAERLLTDLGSGSVPRQGGPPTAPLPVDGFRPGRLLKLTP